MFNYVHFITASPGSVKLMCFLKKSSSLLPRKDKTKTLFNKSIYLSIRQSGFIEITNKRPMGHIAHLRKQFKSLNKYDYIITLIQRIKKILYDNLLVLHLNKLKSPSPKDALCQDWFKLAQWFWSRIF